MSNLCLIVWPLAWPHVNCLQGLATFDFVPAPAFYHCLCVEMQTAEGCFCILQIVIVFALYWCSQGMRAKELKALCQERGISTQDCFDKDSLAARLLQRA